MATSTDGRAFAGLDRAKFFPALKPMFGSYTQAQVDRLNHLLAVFLAYAFVLDRRLLAYIIATSFLGTRRRMQPVCEGFATTDAGTRAAVAKLFVRDVISRGYTLPNARGLSFFGRGDVQLTFQDNYGRMGMLLGVPLAGQPGSRCAPAGRSEQVT